MARPQLHMRQRMLRQRQANERKALLKKKTITVKVAELSEPGIDDNDKGNS